MELFMRKTYVATLALAVGLAAPLTVQAQGTVPGAAAGAAAGGAAAGPVGAVVGGAVGAATGTVGGILGVDTRPRFRTYVQGRNVPSYEYSETVRVGARLPASGVTYYDVPAEYGPATKYKYTVVNKRPVLVDPSSYTIVEVID
jgi:hypothetical protein